MGKHGFTLSELLIALGILGVIATFTIPKILNSQANSQKTAVFKEAIATVVDINYSGSLQGEITCPNRRDYFLDRINAIQICNTDSEAQGCWPQASFAGESSLS